MQTLDLTQFSCPEPLLQTRLWLRQAQQGEQIQLILADALAGKDIQSLLLRKGHRILSTQTDLQGYRLLLEKSSPAY